MLLVVTADDLFVLLVGWEVMGVCSYFLISHHWEQADARAGAVKAFLMTRLGDVGLLFGIFVLGVRGRHASGSAASSAAALDGGIPERTATVATLLLLCGVVGKSAQFPLHTWLPDAMAGPTPISALIHAATMVAAGVYLVARLYAVFLLAPTTLTVLAVIAAITMLGSALAALAPGRPQAGAGLVDGQPARLHVRRPRGRLGRRRRRSTCSRTARSRRCCSSPPAR